MGDNLCVLPRYVNAMEKYKRYGLKLLKSD